MLAEDNPALLAADFQLPPAPREEDRILPSDTPRPEEVLRGTDVAAAEQGIVTIASPSLPVAWAPRMTAAYQQAHAA